MNRCMLSILLLLLIGVMGCAMLQESDPVEISASRLTCQENPERVDGNLETRGEATRMANAEKKGENGNSPQRCCGSSS